MIKDYQVYCFDLDGTVYHGTEAVPEAGVFIKKLQYKGIEPYYITNNSSATPAQVQEKLAGFGITAKVDHIMTSAIATARYCKENYPNATVQMIGEKGLEAALQAEGIQIVQENPDVVVVGIDRAIDYEKLSAVSLAIRAGAKFIGTNGDKAIPSERGLLPGNGSFIKLIEFTTGVTPTIIGKPAAYMLRYIQQKSGVTKEEMVMIGDNYDTDILGGIRYGVDTVHLDGGVTSTADLKNKKEQPTYFLKYFTDWLI